MTNQPLTALDELLIEIAHKCTLKPTSVIKAGLKAYAAQQNAELVDKLETETARNILLDSFNQRLKAENERLKQQLADAEINFNALADGTIKDEALGLLRVENERLKQQVRDVENALDRQVEKNPNTLVFRIPPKEAT